MPKEPKQSKKTAPTDDQAPTDKDKSLAWQDLDDIVLTPEEEAEVDALAKRLNLAGPGDPEPDDDLDDLLELDDDDDVLAQVAGGITMDAIKQKLTPEQVRVIDAWDEDWHEYLVDLANDPDAGMDYIISHWGWIEAEAEALKGF